jgi:hypothetical protein
MFEITKVADQIQDKINRLEMGRALLKDKARFKAEAEASYDKQIAITILKLKNGEEIEFEGQAIKNPPVTIIEKTAKGICWKEKLAMTQTDLEYKNTVRNVDIVMSQLNGWQSIFRHLEEK